MTRLALGLIAGLASLPAYAEDLPQTVPATDSAVSTMTDAERKAFRDEMRAYLLDHPEVLIEAMDVLQRREEDAALARDTQFITVNSALIFANTNDWVGGNPKGDITLVEFMDYRCGYCRKAYDEVDKLIKTDGNIRFVVKEFPILGEASMLSAQFAIALRQLHGDEAYAKAHDALMTLRGEPTPETLARLATDLGFEAKPILDRMQAPEVQAVIAENYALAEQMDITGTPAFVLKDMVMRGYAPLETMQDFVKEARSDG
ncbi:MAG: DsbA family protein [Tabrizicola sp.]|jgi:protein-disulfide isomerase|uniref:DsbA family protein n=1 Tax=Tabrizicola sp. TaxID=2005166 RepID=UPI001B6E46A2|nr:thioredoxin domain-containing protein [Fuscovulum sp.]MCC6518295.1 thioredoxin domain-containing protein [Tabrizicola sp.]